MNFYEVFRIMEAKLKSWRLILFQKLLFGLFKPILKFIHAAR